MKLAIVLGTAAAALVLGSASVAAQTQPADSSATAAPHDTPHPAPAAAPTRVRRSPNEISYAEIEDAHASNAYELIARLRPRWLHDRGPGDKDESGNQVEILVYRGNGQLSGGVDALRSITPTFIERIQYLPPIAAKVRYGPSAGHGAIVIIEPQ